MSQLSLNEQHAINKIISHINTFFYDNNYNKNYIKKKELVIFIRFINKLINNVCDEIKSDKLEEFNRIINAYITSLYTNFIFKTNKQRLLFIVEKIETYFN